MSRQQGSHSSHQLGPNLGVSPTWIWEFLPVPPFSYNQFFNIQIIPFLKLIEKNISDSKFINIQNYIICNANLYSELYYNTNLKTIQNVNYILNSTIYNVTLYFILYNL